MQTARYGNYGLVNVLVIEGALAQISHNGNEFWVKADRLKKPPFVPATKEPEVDTAANSWGTFVDYLRRTRYTLEVHTREDGLAQAEAEYFTWSGESLPAAAICHYENRPLPREWRLTFRLADGVPVPFPIEIGGITGKHPDNHPRGLLHEKGRVRVYYSSIIEQLIRAGLRVSK